MMAVGEREDITTAKNQVYGVMATGQQKDADADISLETDEGSTYENIANPYTLHYNKEF